MTPAQVMDELALSQAIAFYAWSVENDVWGGMERATAGYVGQAVKQRTKDGG